MMKKSTPALLGVVFLFLISTSWFISIGNQMVVLDESVNEKWSQVENVYQRRSDLVPNLVNTVKGYAKHESEVLEEVTRARSQVGQVKMAAPTQDLTENPNALKQFDLAQSQLSGALSRLMVVVEKYPELKADRSFLELQSQLEGTENRIAVERMRFNEAAKEYNVYLRRFPQSFVANLRGFQPRAYFQSEATAKTAPKVQF